MDGNQQVPTWQSYRQLAEEEVSFIKKQAANYAVEYNITNEVAEKQLARGALYSIDDDWRAAYERYAPNEVDSYKIAAAYLQQSAKKAGITFTNDEQQMQAAFTVTPSQNHVDYGLKASLINPEIRAFYEKNAKVGYAEQGSLNIATNNTLATAATAYYLNETVLNTLLSAKAFATKKSDMNIQHSPHPIDNAVTLAKTIYNDPLGTISQMKDSAVDAVQDYVLTKYISELQGDMRKSAQADGEALATVGTGAVAEAGSAKVAGAVFDAAKTSQLGIALVSQSKEAYRQLENRIGQIGAVIAVQPELAMAGVGVVGQYPDVRSTTMLNAQADVSPKYQRGTYERILRDMERNVDRVEDLDAKIAKLDEGDSERLLKGAIRGRVIGYFKDNLRLLERTKFEMKDENVQLVAPKTANEIKAHEAREHWLTASNTPEMKDGKLTPRGVEPQDPQQLARLQQKYRGAMENLWPKDLPVEARADAPVLFKSSKLSNVYHNTNPTGDRINCVSCAEALVESIKGSPVSANRYNDSLYHQANNDILIEAHNIPKENIFTDFVGVEKQMLRWGDGAIAIVAGQRDTFKGHNFLVVNDAGTVRFLDRQADNDLLSPKGVDFNEIVIIRVDNPAQRTLDENHQSLETNSAKVKSLTSEERDQDLKNTQSLGESAQKANNEEPLASLDKKSSDHAVNYLQHNAAKEIVLAQIIENTARQTHVSKSVEDNFGIG